MLNMQQQWQMTKVMARVLIVHDLFLLACYVVYRVVR